MGSDESHFNVSVGSDGQSHKTVSTNHNLFEEKGEHIIIIIICNSYIAPNPTRLAQSTLQFKTRMDIRINT